MLLRAVVLFLLTLGLSSPLLGEDKVISIDESDSEMNAAIAEARETLPGFWQHLASPAVNEADFSLKLAISDGSATEHFWCSDIEGSAAAATCMIANDPQTVFTVKYGQRVDVDPALISDWMYLVDGKIHGARTLRVLLGHMPEEEAANYREMLADD